MLSTSSPFVNLPLCCIKHVLIGPDVGFVEGTPFVVVNGAVVVGGPWVGWVVVVIASKVVVGSTPRVGSSPQSKRMLCSSMIPRTSLSIITSPAWKSTTTTCDFVFGRADDTTAPFTDNITGSL